MGKSLFLVFSVINLLMSFVQLFLPIPLRVDVYYDMYRRKLSFSIYLFKFLRIFGGYIATYKGGFAIHISNKKAIILPYSKLNSERKRFSFVRTFHVKSLTQTTETGAEYLLPIALTHIGIRAYYLMLGAKKDNLEQNLWLTDGDVLRESISLVVHFSIFMLLKQFFRFCKEKWYGRKKTKSQQRNRVVYGKA